MKTTHFFRRFISFSHLLLFIYLYPLILNATATKYRCIRAWGQWLPAYASPLSWGGGGCLPAKTVQISFRKLSLPPSLQNILNLWQNCEEQAGEFIPVMRRADFLPPL